MLFALPNEESLEREETFISLDYDLVAGLEALGFEINGFVFLEEDLDRKALGDRERRAFLARGNEDTGSGVALHDGIDGNGESLGVFGNGKRGADREPWDEGVAGIGKEGHHLKGAGAGFRFRDDGERCRSDGLPGGCKSDGDLFSTRGGSEALGNLKPGLDFA